MREFRQQEATNPSSTKADLANIDRDNLDEPIQTNSDESIQTNLDEAVLIDSNRERELERADSQRRAFDAAAPSIDRRRAAGASAAQTVPENNAAPLFSLEESNGLHAQWDAIQVSFVDEPRQAVQEADGLVWSALLELCQ